MWSNSIKRVARGWRVTRHHVILSCGLFFVISSSTVNMPQFLNEKILNERWKELLFIVGHIFSTNLMFFQSRTIGYLDLFDVFTYFLCS
jgi:hypothetical protein